MQAGAEVIGELFNRCDYDQLAGFSGREPVAHFQHGAAPGNAYVMNRFCDPVA